MMEITSAAATTSTALHYSTATYSLAFKLFLQSIWCFSWKRDNEEKVDENKESDRNVSGCTINPYYVVLHVGTCKPPYSQIWTIVNSQFKVLRSFCFREWCWFSKQSNLATVLETYCFHCFVSEYYKNRVYGWQRNCHPLDGSSLSFELSRLWLVFRLSESLNFNGLFWASFSLALSCFSRSLTRVSSNRKERVEGSSQI